MHPVLMCSIENQTVYHIIMLFDVKANNGLGYLFHYSYEQVDKIDIGLKSFTQLVHFSFSASVWIRVLRSEGNFPNSKDMFKPWMLIETLKTLQKMAHHDQTNYYRSQRSNSW